MKLYRTGTGIIIEQAERCYRLPQAESWDELFRHAELPTHLGQLISEARPLSDASSDELKPLAPIVSQEVWAAGVTYYRSLDARMEESHDAGGGTFYDRVYSAERPELFFKATPHRVVGPNQPVRMRADSRWNVPEPELTLAINSRGQAIGYTIGNDMSSRDIEGENPLYLPQAKTYDGSCALGPGILITDEPLPKTTAIKLSVTRDGNECFAGATTLAELKRSPQELVSFLFRESSFPAGCFLMTGTGIVPPSTFTLAQGDVIRITIDGIGTLTNAVHSRVPS